MAGVLHVRDRERASEPMAAGMFEAPSKPVPNRQRRSAFGVVIYLPRSGGALPEQTEGSPCPDDPLRQAASIRVGSDLPP